MGISPRNTGISASTLPDSTLPEISKELLCSDHINGICRRGDLCEKSHQLCLPQHETTRHPALEDGLNLLSTLPRRLPAPFENDGPGDLSDLGFRHDNDHIDIQHVRLLPTVDEILCRRPPYMPSRDPLSPHRLPLGPDRLLDINFRQLRYENVEPIIDCCYHASQQLSALEGNAHATDYDDRCRTPKGTHYSLFQNVAFEEIVYHEQKGMMLRVSYACPPNLRGRRMGFSSHFEQGMLVALVGLANGASLSITFMETFMRQTTEAMRPRTGNDLRASIILSFAEPMDTHASRRLLYNFKGILNETFVLVELPGALFAGFRWTLQELQLQASSARGMAFESIIAPSSASDSPAVPPPEYAMGEDFEFKLDILRKEEGLSDSPSLTIKTGEMLSDPAISQKMIDKVCDQTTLDHGQATALCESLCRSLAFTQGPPGTGKTYLGVALARVLLASRPPEMRRPILVVCLTNHALDSFLNGLREAGIASLVRFGNNSKENWTKPFTMQQLSRRFKKTRDEHGQLNYAKSVVDVQIRECSSWCEALNGDALSWPAVREYLQTEDPTILLQFTAVEKTQTLKPADVRYARKAGGVAFEFWCHGGDIKDVDLLLATFNKLLGDDSQGIDTDPRAVKQRDQVVDNIRWNILELEGKTFDSDIWKLPMKKREELFRQWKLEIGLQTTLDRTAEAHRRHQVAIAEKRNILKEIDVRMLADMDVIAMTTTAAAMHRSTMEKLGIQTVMCEEAGEVMEAQFLCTLLPSVNHHISIGDPLQLRPQVNEQSLSLETIQGSKYRLDESLMERLMLPKAHGIMPIASSTLDIQRRMHPEIADIMRATLYPYLQDHESTWEGRSVNGLVDRNWWLDHQVPEDGADTHAENPTSCSNTFEVETIAGLVHYLIDSNEYNYKDITILTPYNGQLAALAHRLRGSYSLWLSEKDREALCQDGLIAPEDMKASGRTHIDVGDMLRLATIDNFQGEESKIVILSTVRSNDSGRVGFMKTVNRINVACSRARNGFYIIGNATLMKTVPMWHQIAALMASKEKIGPGIRTCCPRHPETIHHVKEPDDWYAIPPCDKICDFEFPCGHKCGMTCHAVSLHERMGCTQPCEKTFESCGHQCSRLCGQPCGDCLYQQVSVRLDCGHEAMLSCDQLEGSQAEGMPCNVKIATIILPCGHEQDVLCSNQGIISPCMEKCDNNLECGHACLGTCSSCTQTGQHPNCEAVCQKMNENCKHECLSKCHSTSDCPPCQHPCPKSCKHGGCTKTCSGECENCMRYCDWKCEHEGQCSTLCCLPCSRFPCQQMCPQVLSCGHRCPSLCGEICPTTCLECQQGKAPRKPQMFLPCGHSFDVSELDRHVGFKELYDVDASGKIYQIKASIGRRNINPSCPTCGQSCASIRRYALHHQLDTFPSVLDSIYSRFCRKTSYFLDLMYSRKLSLDSSFRTFQDCLKPGPLNGRNNELRIRERSSPLNNVQESITGFKDDVVVPFETAMASLANFLPKDCAFHTSTMSARLRLEAISRRRKLMVLEDRLKCIQVLETFAEQSSHTPLLIKALKRLTITEAEHELLLLVLLTEECETKKLKRLECEVRLVWTCFQLVLRKLEMGATDDVMEQNLQKAGDLCQNFPESAGLLSPILHNVQRATDPNRRETQTLYAWDLRYVFWYLPKHQIGTLTECPNGHPYSGSTWSGCPECGREVESSDMSSSSASLNPLKNEAFILAMKTLPSTFNANAYRRKPLVESKSLANGLGAQKENAKAVI